MNSMKMLTKIVLLIAISIPVQSMADIWRMTVLDSTGSMGSAWNSTTRMEGARDLALGFVDENTDSTLHDAIFILDGEDSELALEFTSGNTSAAARTIINNAAPGLDTPLADVICLAMDYLETASASDNTGIKMFSVFTDGEENASGDYDFGHVIKCSQGNIDANANEFLFKVDARYAWDLDGTDDEPVNTVQDHLRDAWAPFGSGIQDAYLGRAYETSGNILDWAAGVRPGSWEWLVYYRVAWGDAGMPTSNTNKAWPPSGRSDVVFNVAHFYNDFVPAGGGTARTALTKTLDNGVVLEGKSSPYQKTILRASLPATPTYSEAQMDMYTLKGLSQIGGGRYISAKNGDPIPLFGDLNADGNVNETDLRIVLSWFGRPVDHYNQPSIDSDLFNEGYITNLDIAVVRNNWTDTTKDAPYQGDIDYNWCVSQSDLTQVMQWYGQNVNPSAQQSYHADINGDGKIDASDVAIVNANMNRGCVPCADGWLSAGETDIDCGGEICSKCADGKMCEIDADCLSNDCLDGICIPAAPADLVASVVVTNSWPQGYCANISIKNNKSVATKTWRLNMNMNGGTITGKWSANFSANTGNITVTPMTWNKVIGAGQTITSPGFCANKGAGGTASITGATGTY